MVEDVQLFLEDAKDNMNKALQHLEKEFGKIRAGKAHPQMLEGIMVDYYGTPTPLRQVSNVGISDPRTLVIQPWEKAMIEPIEKAILKANIGLNPDNNGELIRINIPVLTEERRKQLVKQVKITGENAKIGIRQARKDTNDELKKLKSDGVSEDEIKNGEDEVQKLTDKFVKRIDEIIEMKENEIMTI